MEGGKTKKVLGGGGGDENRTQINGGGGWCPKQSVAVVGKIALGTEKRSFVRVWWPVCWGMCGGGRM